MHVCVRDGSGVICKDDEGDDMVVVSGRNYIGRSIIVCQRKGET